MLYGGWGSCLPHPCESRGLNADAREEEGAEEGCSDRGAGRGSQPPRSAWQKTADCADFSPRDSIGIFCAASEPVTVSNLPSLVLPSHSFVLSGVGSLYRHLQPAVLTNVLLRPEQTLIKLLGLCVLKEETPHPKPPCRGSKRGLCVLPSEIPLAFWR